MQTQLYRNVDSGAIRKGHAWGRESGFAARNPQTIQAGHLRRFTYGQKTSRAEMSSLSTSNGTRPEEIEIRPAKQEDVRRIAELINYFARSNLLLPRSEASIREALPHFFVACRGTSILGTCAIHPYTPHLAELRSLTVAPHAQGLGIGSRMVTSTIQEATEQGFLRLFALTYQINFFLRLGFKVVSKQTLPEKVWSDCIRCPRYYDCSEVAMMIRLG